MLASASGDASVLAGGQSLVPLMNFRVAQPAHLVDINYVDELDYIRVDDGWLAIGARTRQAARRALGGGRPRRAAHERGDALGRAIRPCATAGRSSAASSTPTRPPSCPRCCSRSTARS